MPLGVVVGKNDAKEEEEEDCLRARNNTIPKYLHGSSYLQPPAINLGLPKMGSTSLQHFFGCAGYGASHWLCGKDQICARCIEASVDDHLPPLEKCGNNGGPIYAQIDGWGTKGKILFFPQINLLHDIINAYPNGTYFLTFRNIEGWYNSVTNWRSPSNRTLKSRMVRSIPDLQGGSLQNFTNFFCNHVKRVRATVPANRLVEVDIENHNAGQLLSDIFDIDESCWKKTNVNEKLHSQQSSEEKTTLDDRITNNSSVGPSKQEKLPMLIKGKTEIRGKNGVMRMNPSVMRLNLSNRIRNGGEDVLSNMTNKDFT
jgi:hypothetical protein